MSGSQVDLFDGVQQEVVSRTFGLDRRVLVGAKERDRYEKNFVPRAGPIPLVFSCFSASRTPRAAKWPKDSAA